MFDATYLALAGLKRLGLEKHAASIVDSEQMPPAPGQGALAITARAGDTRPVVTPTLGPTWGLHLDDVNLSLGNLVNDVMAEETAYSHRHRTA